MKYLIFSMLICLNFLCCSEINPTKDNEETKNEEKITNENIENKEEYTDLLGNEYKKLLIGTEWICENYQIDQGNKYSRKIKFTDEENCILTNIYTNTLNSSVKNEVETTTVWNIQKDILTIDYATSYMIKELYAKSNLLLQETEIYNLIKGDASDGNLSNTVWLQVCYESIDDAEIYETTFYEDETWTTKATMSETPSETLKNYENIEWDAYWSGTWSTNNNKIESDFFGENDFIISDNCIRILYSTYEFISIK